MNLVVVVVAAAAAANEENERLPFLCSLVECAAICLPNKSPAGARSERRRPQIRLLQTSEWRLMANGGGRLANEIGAANRSSDAGDKLKINKAARKIPRRWHWSCPRRGGAARRGILTSLLRRCSVDLGGLRSMRARNLPAANKDKVALSFEQLEVVRFGRRLVAVENLQQLSQRLLEVSDRGLLLAVALT